jgi:hypothetical protein
MTGLPDTTTPYYYQSRFQQGSPELATGSALTLERLAAGFVCFFFYGGVAGVTKKNRFICWCRYLLLVRMPTFNANNKKAAAIQEHAAEWPIVDVLAWLNQ